MTKSKKINTYDESEENSCTHHWMIDPPNGPTSKGKCKFCGEQKVFNNVMSAQESSAWRQSERYKALKPELRAS